MNHLFLHDLQVVIGQWSTGSEKTNEPTLLRRHLKELLDAYPMLHLLTGEVMAALEADNDYGGLMVGQGFPAAVVYSTVDHESGNGVACNQLRGNRETEWTLATEE